MKIIAAALAVLAGITGFIAAWYWYQSSQVQIDPGWTPPGTGGPVEPDGEAAQAMGWVMATMVAISKASELNKKAATWTALSVALTATASILSVWAL